MLLLLSGHKDFIHDHEFVVNVKHVFIKCKGLINMYSLCKGWPTPLIHIETSKTEIYTQYQKLQNYRAIPWLHISKWHAMLLVHTRVLFVFLCSVRSLCWEMEIVNLWQIVWITLLRKHMIWSKTLNLLNKKSNCTRIIMVQTVITQCPIIWSILHKLYFPFSKNNWF